MAKLKGLIILRTGRNGARGTAMLLMVGLGVGPTTVTLSIQADHTHVLVMAI